MSGEYKSSKVPKDCDGNQKGIIIEKKDRSSNK